MEGEGEGEGEGRREEKRRKGPRNHNPNKLKTANRGLHSPHLPCRPGHVGCLSDPDASESPVTDARGCVVCRMRMQYGPPRSSASQHVLRLPVVEV